MNFIDILLGVLILYGIIKGFVNGLFIEVASLIALIAGIFGAIHFSYITGTYLHHYLDWEEKYINLTAFAVTFVVIITLITLVGKLLTRIADMAALGVLNKLLGSLFGGLKFVVVIGGLLIFFSKIEIPLPLTDPSTTESSVLYEPVKNLGGILFQYILESDPALPTPDPDTTPETL